MPPSRLMALLGQVSLHTAKEQSTTAWQSDEQIPLVSPSVPEVAAASGPPASRHDHRLVQRKSCGEGCGGGALPHPAHQANQGGILQTGSKPAVFLPRCSYTV